MIRVQKVRHLSTNVQVYDVVDTGELMEVSVSGELQGELKAERVLIIVDDDDRKIWLWKGIEAGVRKKFIAARQGQAVRSQRGLVYKVLSVDGGEEPDSFLALMGVKPAVKEPKPEVEVKVDLPDRTIEIPPEATLPAPKPEKPVTPKAKPKPEPVPAPAMPVAPNELGTEYDGAEQNGPSVSLVVPVQLLPTTISLGECRISSPHQAIVANW